MKYTINGVTLNLAESGQGEEALVLLHYFGGSSRTWAAVTDLLGPEYHCLALDARGWGDSDAPARGYTVADMADDAAGLIAAGLIAAGLIAARGPARYALVGHSMGGKAAQALAARRPAGLTRLLLVGPSPLSPEPMTEEARAKMRAAWGDAGAARETLRSIARLPLPPDWEETVIADNLRASRAAWEAWADGGSREDLSALAGEIAVPTCVLAGDADPVLPPDVLRREVVARIPGAALETVPGAGHLLPLEAPDAVARWIRAKMARV